VTRAVGHVEREIRQALLDLDPSDQAVLDERLIELDATPNKSRLGANAILGASLAAAHAAAASRCVPLFEHIATLWQDTAREPPQPALPLPMVNMISGGLHAGRRLEIQDFLAVPVGASSYEQALEWVVRVYRALGRVLRDHGDEADLVADEGGYGPRLASNEQAIERVLEAIEAAALRPGADVAIALDVAASHFHDPATGNYALTSPSNRALDAAGLIDRLAEWFDRYPIVSIEDALVEDDWAGWRRLTERIGTRIQLLGDDLFCTNLERLTRGVSAGAANAVLIKPNQVGTLTETLQAIALARRSGYAAVVSARSGETEDVTIAHLAVATGAGQIKIGSVARSERLAKYNELLRIEEVLGGPERAPYAGRTALAPNSG
jgi:enolase